MTQQAGTASVPSSLSSTPPRGRLALRLAITPGARLKGIAQWLRLGLLFQGFGASERDLHGQGPPVGLGSV